MRLAGLPLPHPGLARREALPLAHAVGPTHGLRRLAGVRGRQPGLNGRALAAEPRHAPRQPQELPQEDPEGARTAPAVHMHRTCSALHNRLAPRTEWAIIRVVAKLRSKHWRKPCSPNHGSNCLGMVHDNLALRLPVLAHI